MEEKNILAKNLLYKKFYDGLKQYNISKQQFHDYNFQYCGKFKPPKNECNIYVIPQNNEQLLYKYRDEINYYFFQYFSNFEILKLTPQVLYKSNCICGIKIIKNYFIYSRSQDMFLIIGSCCNKQFNENGNKKFCFKCGIEHKNRSNNLCKDCRKIEKYKTKFNQCSDCGINKKEDKFPQCFKCGNIGKELKTYIQCNKCNKPKTKNTFQTCYTCYNNKKQ